MKETFKLFGIDEKTIALYEKCEQKLKTKFEEIDNIAMYNTAKVLKAFRDNRISETHFNPTTGYGYDDCGREAIEKVYASVFNAEDALVRIQFVNGTHALSTALFACLMPGDTMLSITGQPYDTLCETIGIVENPVSLKAYGVSYKQVDLMDNEFNIEAIKEVLTNNKIKMIFIGRSRGYSSRLSLTISKIANVIKEIRSVDKDVIIMLDNCYGEFVEKLEPTEVGADIIAGSLIKNLGGGICETGGYIVGRHDLIESAARHLTAPGIGKECGASLGKNRQILQGMFLAPNVVASSIKASILAAAMLEELGYDVSPKAFDERTDIIQAITFNNKEKLIKFIQGIQAASPVDSFVLPEPWAMPGYTDEVIMAAGTFISGASIELSADAPVREPYIAFMQGGLTYPSAALAICKAISNMQNLG